MRRKNYEAGRKIARQINENPQIRDEIIALCRELQQPLTKQAVYAWQKLEKGIPAERVPVVSRVMNLPMHQIRPDVFPAA